MRYQGCRTEACVTDTRLGLLNNTLIVYRR